jgi:transaldolase/glucose-6-phosphate isomerase
VTSNPSIFEKAIAHGDAYDAQLLALLQSRPGTSITQAYEALAVQDIQDAADTLQPVYERLNRTDGYVSLEVSPISLRAPRRRSRKHSGCGDRSTVPT